MKRVMIERKESNNLFYIFFLILSLLVILDFISTTISINIMGFYEKNPFPRYLFETYGVLGWILWLVNGLSVFFIFSFLSLKLYSFLIFIKKPLENFEDKYFKFLKFTHIKDKYYINFLNIVFTISFILLSLPIFHAVVNNFSLIIGEIIK